MNYIVDDIGKVVEAMRIAMTPDPAPDPHEPGAGKPYYMYGHRLEIANRLLEKDQDAVYKYQKYPLVALRMDIPETMANGIISYRLNIAILEFTDKNYNAEERYTNVLKPVLYPLYELFMDNLKKSGLFFWTGKQNFPEHTKIDRPFWGTPTSEKNDKYIFNDPLDAIEIIDLKINQRIKTC